MKSLTLAVAALLAVTGMADEPSLQLGNRAAVEDAKTVEGRFNDAFKREAAGVDAFGFEIAVEASEKEEYGMPWQQVLLSVRSAKAVPSDAGYFAIQFSKSIRPGLIDITATELRHVSTALIPRTMFAEKMAQIRLETLPFVTDRPIYVRLRFRDAEEYFALAFRPAQGVRLVPIKAAFGKVTKESLKDVANLEAKGGQRIYQCDNLQIVAHENCKDLWTRRIPLRGTPKQFRIVEDMLFVLSSDGHSLYVRKSDGKIVYYHTSALAGKSAWDEVLAVTLENYKLHEPGKSELSRAIGVAALLKEKRAAPFLIECVEKGNGLPERWWAVAALEHLNGNSTHWKALGEGQPWDAMGRSGEWDISRVYPDSAMKAEVEKWEKVFGKVKTQVLTGSDK